MSNVMVSIYCTTYNHEKYISEALESFLMQKTNFKYEILIHDDASTDNTAKIIREYEKKYPEIIKPIYQKINQYSKKIKISIIYNYSRAKGKYIALCEGDDYWIDENKLQIQVEYMKRHPKCSLCTHVAQKVSRDKKVIGVVRPNKGDKKYTTDDVILGGGGMFATNSMFFHTNLVQSLPDFYKNAPVGDYPLTIFLSLYGNIYFIDKCMSAYRIMSEGSWSSNIQANKSKKTEHNKKITQMLYEINEYTKYKYLTAIEKHLVDNEVNLLISNNDRSILKSDKYFQLRNKLTIKQKIKIYIKVYFPLITKLRNKLRELV
jgi:glycosyltransferase involved in cell wall biosynthesis